MPENAEFSTKLKILTGRLHEEDRMLEGENEAISDLRKRNDGQSRASGICEIRDIEEGNRKTQNKIDLL